MRKKIQERIVVSFTIRPDRLQTDIRIHQPLDPIFPEESAPAVEATPIYARVPGMKRKKIGEVRYNLPSETSERVLAIHADVKVNPK